MKILGIDYGLAKVGLALADENLAQPLKVVKNSPRLIEKITRFCQTEGVEKIVIGLPEGKISGAVRKFAADLALATNLPIIFWDETLTSREAVAKMVAAGKRQKARREEEDAVAAAIILQNFIDSDV